MMTHGTLDEARVAAQAAGVRYVIEIDHRTEGRRYIAARAPLATLARNLKALPEIARLVSEHPVGLVPTAPRTLTLAEQRVEIVRRSAGHSAFPGSREWLAASAALRELAAFDAAHPEVLAGTLEADRLAFRAAHPDGYHD